MMSYWKPLKTSGFSSDDVCMPRIHITGDAQNDFPRGPCWVEVRFDDDRRFYQIHMNGWHSFSLGKRNFSDRYGFRFMDAFPLVEGENGFYKVLEPNKKYHVVFERHLRETGKELSEIKGIE